MKWHFANSTHGTHRLRRSAATSRYPRMSWRWKPQDRYGRVDVLINNAGIITGQFTGSVSAWLGTNWMSPGMKFRLSRKIRVTRQLSEHIERVDIVGREPP